ncbi:transcription initiation factor TFIID subunit 1-like [Carica papaya]|uniref:transcription initiation factor TFIID subunit 1-like n=1 Tax=Carica papaya TaxID=3649 RepID=UPI000B8CBB68|nr:transcription initiation factor TFIID subunit 1-like [Carica papaya]
MPPSCDDDEEYEESGGNQLLGFMFGNVDNSGDLDVDYLDEDAKEHLSALADKLGASLTDIDLLEKSSNVRADSAEQDYDAKAEDAVNYEDIEEQYEGPEVQATSEEDYLLPKKDFFSSEVSLGTAEHTNSVFDDENYDEDVECENNQGAVERQDETTVITTISGEYLVDMSEGEKSPGHDRQLGLLNADNQLEVAEDLQEVVADVLEGPLDGKSLTSLPVLCIEDGMVILRFSEIFGIHEPLKKEEKRGHRYFTYREKYKCMGTSDLFEEDEEAFLKGDPQGFSIVKEEEAIQHDFMSDDGSDLVKLGAIGNVSIPSQVDEPRKDSCVSGEPMEDLTFSFSTGWQSQLCAIFPLDQQQWEERILWDDSPAMSDNSQSSKFSGPDLEGWLSRERDPEAGPREHVQMDLIVKPDGRDHTSLVHNYPVLLESFDSDKPSGTVDLPVFEGYFHPQLLRLESRLEVGASNRGDDGHDNLAVELLQSDVLRHFNKLTLQNRDMMEESWLDDIIWEPHKSISKPKLILDLQDEQMLFEILDNKDSGHLELHAGAMILSPSVKLSNGDSFELHGRKYQSGWQFNISNDKSYINGKTFQQLQSNSNKRMVHCFKIHHSAPALKLQTMKLKLSK